jgi:hypothetical protein
MQKRRQASTKKWLPRSRTGRIIVGGALVAGGLVGFLPVVGFWMIPLGIGVLSVDVPIVRRFARNAKVKIGRWRQKRRRADPPG